MTDLGGLEAAAHAERPDLADRAPTEDELRAWAVRVLDRTGLRYEDRHVLALMPGLARIAETSPALADNRRARREAARVGRRLRRRRARG